MHHTETVFTNWFYPQNSELLHAVGILLTERDTLSLFINFGWLASPSSRLGDRPAVRARTASVVAVAIVIECHTLVVREPGAAKNDIVAAALLLAADAIIIKYGAAAKTRPGAGEGLGLGLWRPPRGVAVGLAAGTKVTVCSPRRRRRASP